MVPSKQRLFIEGQPFAQEADLERLDEGAKILVARKKQGGSGKKGSARQSVIDRTRKLTFKETKRLMAVRSSQNKDLLFREYKQGMEEETNLSDPVGMVVEEAYEKKLEKKRVKLHNTLKTNVKKDDSIQVMSLNINGINMSKRFNHKADMLRDLINK